MGNRLTYGSRKLRYRMTLKLNSLPNFLSGVYDRTVADNDERMVSAILWCETDGQGAYGFRTNIRSGVPEIEIVFRFESDRDACLFSIFNEASQITPRRVRRDKDLEQCLEQLPTSYEGLLRGFRIERLASHGRWNQVAQLIMLPELFWMPYCPEPNE